MNAVPLTKTRFATALECPRKLDYQRDPRYVDAGSDDEFLQSLAEGGHQVGALARLMFPGGILITGATPDEQVKETALALAQPEITLFEATIRHGSLLVRCDILRKSGNQLDLIEVKAKGYREGDDKFLTVRKGAHPIASEWRPYLYDVAFQTYVLRAAFPKFQVVPHLMLLDKGVCVPLSGLGTSIRVDTAGGKVRTRTDPQFDAAQLIPPVLRKVNVDVEVERLLQQPVDALRSNQSFEEFAAEVAKILAEGKSFPASVGSQCKQCQFYAEPSEISADNRSGWAECVSSHTGDSTPLPKRESIFSLYRLGAKDVDQLVTAGQLRIRDASSVEAKDGTSARDTIEPAFRRHLQRLEARGELTQPYKLSGVLQGEIERWKWPLHFIDFETSRPALPYNARRTPYDQIFFQFSHHVLERSGGLSHRTQVIEAVPGVASSATAMMQLRNALSSDDGSVIHWWDHERTVLNEIRRQMQADQADGHTEMSEFVESMLGEDKKGGRMADLGRLFERTVFLPGTNGRSSLKLALPAMLRHCEPLQRRYAKPIYGTDEMPSFNFNQWRWVVLNGQEIRDPYELLDPLLADAALDSLSRHAEDNEGLGSTAFVANGGAAIIAYDQLQRIDLPNFERERLRKQLLRYCELDTLAMVIVYQGLTMHGLG
jgi:hypothetical protein